LVQSWGWFQALKAALKIWSGRRIFFWNSSGSKVVQSGWANIGFCRHYDVEPNSVVLGTLWTEPEFRGRGLASSAIIRTIAFLHRRGYKRFYIDTSEENIASQRMIAKAGFTQRMD